MKKERVMRKPYSLARLLSEQQALAADAELGLADAEDDDGHLVTVVEHITPGLASTYLALNVEHNRNLRERYVLELAKDMLSGRWKLSGDPIRFDTNGRLIDGQHRLKALEMAGTVEPGIVIRFAVMRGITPSAMHVIDTGRGRRPGDALRIAGHVNTALLASAARILLQLKDGPLTIKRSHGSDHSHSEILEMVERHPLLIESTHGLRAIRGIRPSNLVAIHYIGSHLLNMPTAADAYMQVFSTGVQNYAGDPAHMLRERLLRDRTDKARTLSSFSLLAMVHVWNHFSKGNAVKVLKFPHEVTIDGLDVDKL